MAAEVRGFGDSRCCRTVKQPPGRRCEQKPLAANE
uniref:Uncharacterized protein n=1 Tax=Anguilla anguilla TaxID=7936 RepID=A0A0E9UIQ3_ANGAN